MLKERENKAKLQLLCDKITDQSRERLIRDNLYNQTNLDNTKAVYKIKKKYTYIDIGGSGKYMVNDEGQIYGIKAYGKIHLGHCYGNLNTINDFYWGDYTARKIVSDHKHIEYEYKY